MFKLRDLQTSMASLYLCRSPKFPETHNGRVSSSHSQFISRTLTKRKVPDFRVVKAVCIYVYVCARTFNFLINSGLTDDLKQHDYQYIMN
jgi:hypothetical protein